MKTKTIRDQLRDAIAKSISSLGIESTIDIDHPEESKHGDYSTNIALTLARSLKRNPMDIGKDMKDLLVENSEFISETVDRIEITPPGFINFFIKDAFLDAHLDQCVECVLKKRSLIIMEFTDANPFKEFHIGHLYSNAVGESVSRLLESAGHTVKRANYFGDVGMHVAKAIWGMQQIIKKDFNGSKKDYIDHLNKHAKPGISELGKAYAYGAHEFEESLETKKIIQQLNIYIYIAAQKELPQKDQTIAYQALLGDSFDEHVLQDVLELYGVGKKLSIANLHAIVKRLGTNFDVQYPESLCSEYGYQLVQDGLLKGTFEKSDGAIIYRGENDGFHTRVFVNSYGLPTYEAKEMGLAYRKSLDFPFDLSLSVTGNEIDEYFKTVMSAFSKIKPEISEKIKHLGHGMVRLKTGKMSSRFGNILTGEWLLDEAKKTILDILTRSEKTYSEEQKHEIAEACAIAAVKYSLLKVSLPSSLDFDLHESINLEGDSGPYLLYTYARSKSVMGKSHEDQLETREQESQKERELKRMLLYFPEIVEDAVQLYAPNMLCTYLYKLAQNFNTFYATSRISGNPNRVKITQCTSDVLKKGLYLLGIETVEKM